LANFSSAIAEAKTALGYNCHFIEIDESLHLYVKQNNYEQT